MRVKFIEDLPADEFWLSSKLYDVSQAGVNQYGVPKYMGPITGYFSRPIYLPLEALVTIPGEHGEQNAIREQSLTYIRLNYDVVMKELPYIEIDPYGKAWVNEGNHRIMVAAERGEKSLLVEVRYFTGGQKLAKDFSPENLIWVQRYINDEHVLCSTTSHHKDPDEVAIQPQEVTGRVFYNNDQ